MRRTTRFRRLIEAKEILVLPGAHDALSARLIEQAGFAAITAGGYSATATLLGQPDTGQLSVTEMADFYARLCDSVALPLFADADTGYGNVTNVARTVRSYERAGVAGLFIEDQVAPKRCGHMAGKAVIPAEEMVGKVKAALDARVDPDLVIMARTDALTVTGLDDAIDRAQLYREAGADLIFVESPRSVAEMRRICTEIDAPLLANNVEAGLSPILPAAELQKIGYAAVVYPVAATYAVARAVSELMATLKRDGTTAAYRRRMATFDEFNAMVGLPELRRSEAEKQDFAHALMQRARGDNKRATGTAGRKRRK
ncbi:MAG: isocitrate lyase/PEP mutase family protein [Alphaproteobacteria bacterium]|nr:isocitrate lyase/PEP mutase family protein [Alphaproteobacteria bacterium]